MINNQIIKLFENAISNDISKVGNALNDLGLLVERHTQNRYQEKDYLLLFGNNEELFNLYLEDIEVKLITNFFFFHIINYELGQITTAWCLGKCYNQNIYKGMLSLLKVFKYNDEVCEQLLFSMNSLYDPRLTLVDIIDILKDRLNTAKMPKTSKVIISNKRLLKD